MEIERRLVVAQLLADPNMGEISNWFSSISEIQKYAKSVYLNEKNLSNC